MKLFVAFALMVPSPVAIVAAQTPPAPVTLETPAMIAGEKLVAALNSDAASRRAFAAETFSSGALANEPAATRAALLDELALQSQGFSMVQAIPRSDRHVDLVLRAKSQERFVTAVLFTSSKEAGKISGLFFLPARDPSKAAREAWPTQPVPASALPKEIHWRVTELERDQLFYGAVLVAKRDEVLFRKAYGPADKEGGIPNKPDTLFHSASVGKMFTAAAVLRLADTGKLSLDDTLGRWVPEYPHQAAAAKITLRHLLTHTAGLRDWARQFEQHGSQRAAVSTMTEPPGEPGAGMSYSNAGYVLLGAVLEAATGQSYAEAVGTLVFKRAGMKATTLKAPSSIANDAKPYHYAQDDPVGFKGLIPNSSNDALAGDASGGAYTTVDDLLAFHRALVEGRLLSPKMTADLLEPKVDFPGTPRPSRYGYGLRFGECSGRPVFGHSGGGPNAGISNATYATTDGEWTVIVLSNSNGAGEDLAISLCEMVARR